MKVDRNAPLSAQDTPEQTLGCRHTNPNSCKMFDLENVCAFVRADKLCLKPPGSWKKQFKELNSKVA